MRIYAAILVAIFFLVCAGCGPRLQPAVQGEWSNVHNDKDRISEDARPGAAESY